MTPGPCTICVEMGPPVFPSTIRLGMQLNIGRDKPFFQLGSAMVSRGAWTSGRFLYRVSSGTGALASSTSLGHHTPPKYGFLSHGVRGMGYFAGSGEYARRRFAAASRL